MSCYCGRQQRQLNAVVQISCATMILSRLSASPQTSPKAQTKGTFVHQYCIAPLFFALVGRKPLSGLGSVGQGRATQKTFARVVRKTDTAIRVSALVSGRHFHKLRLSLSPHLSPSLHLYPHPPSPLSLSLQKTRVIPLASTRSFKEREKKCAKRAMH
jgi:hypothetical protein